MATDSSKVAEKGLPNELAIGHRPPLEFRQDRAVVILKGNRSEIDLICVPFINDHHARPAGMMESISAIESCACVHP